MKKKILLNNKEFEQQVIRFRLLVATGIIIISLLSVIVRLFYLQVIEYDHFTTLSQDNRVKVLPIAPIRGLIYSRDGVLLADNYPSFSLEVTPEKVDDLDQTIEFIQSLIEITPDQLQRFNKLLIKKRKFESIPLKFNLAEDELARLSINSHKLPGVDMVARLNRFYPYGSTTVHSIGYVGRIDENELKQVDKTNYRGTSHIGKLGIEKSYEHVLHGNVGYQQVEVNAQGRIIRVLERKAPESGKNLHLTLDLSLQQVANDALTDKRGAIVAMDPRNGEVLAFVSTPGYNPNLFVNGIDTKSYQALLNSSDKPLINRVLNGKYPPGSTIKPFLGYGALETQAVRDWEQVWCPGWFSLKGNTHRYRDWKKQGHGHANLNDAIMESCDVYFYSLAYEMGIDNIFKQLSEFGLGKVTGIDIQGESSALLPSREWKRKKFNQPWYPGETVIVGIGQGYTLVTPLQLATATSALANLGTLFQPGIVKSIVDPITKLETVLEPKIINTIANTSAKHWQTIVDSMINVVHGAQGTARRTGLGSAYQIAGKTGTAQVVGIAQDEEYDKDTLAEEFHDHAWFIAFAPATDPIISVAILVENGGSGSASAAPIARRLFDQYILGGTSTEVQSDGT